MFEDIKLKTQMSRSDRATVAANQVLIFRDSVAGLRAIAAGLSVSELAELKPLTSAARETIKELSLLLEELGRSEERDST